MQRAPPILCKPLCEQCSGSDKRASNPVLGEGSVVVIDARKANVAEAGEGELQSASGIEISVLKSGDKFELPLDFGMFGSKRAAN